MHKDSFGRIVIDELLECAAIRAGTEYMLIEREARATALSQKLDQTIDEFELYMELADGVDYNLQKPELVLNNLEPVIAYGALEKLLLYEKNSLEYVCAVQVINNMRFYLEASIK